MSGFGCIPEILICCIFIFIKLKIFSNLPFDIFWSIDLEVCYFVFRYVVIYYRYFWFWLLILIYCCQRTRSVSLTGMFWTFFNLSRLISWPRIWPVLIIGMCTLKCVILLLSGMSMRSSPLALLITEKGTLKPLIMIVDYLFLLAVLFSLQAFWNLYSDCVLLIKWPHYCCEMTLFIPRFFVLNSALTLTANHAVSSLS